jgi:hypothetical protein
VRMLPDGTSMPPAIAPACPQPCPANARCICYGVMEPGAPGQSEAMIGPWCSPPCPPVAPQHAGGVAPQVAIGCRLPCWAAATPGSGPPCDPGMCSAPSSGAGRADCLPADPPCASEPAAPPTDGEQAPLSPAPPPCLMPDQRRGVSPGAAGGATGAAGGSVGPGTVASSVPVR